MSVRLWSKYIAGRNVQITITLSTDTEYAHNMTHQFHSYIYTVEEFEHSAPGYNNKNI